MCSMTPSSTRKPPTAIRVRPRPTPGSGVRPSPVSARPLSPGGQELLGPHGFDAFDRNPTAGNGDQRGGFVSARELRSVDDEARQITCVEGLALQPLYRPHRSDALGDRSAV